MVWRTAQEEKMNSCVLTLGELGAGPTRLGQVQTPYPELGLWGLEMRLARKVLYTYRAVARAYTTIGGAVVKLEEVASLI